MHGGGSAPSCCAFTHRVAFEEGSGPRVLLKSGPGNRGHSACGPTHVARLEFPREASLILRCAWKAGTPFQTTQGNRLSCRDPEGRRGSDEAVPGPSVFPSREPCVSVNLGVAGRLSATVSPFRAEEGTSLETPSRARASSCQEVGTPWFFSSCGGNLELRRGSQASSWVGPGKVNLRLELRGKAGGCARVTAGPKKPHLGVCPGPNIPLQGRQGSRGCIPGSPGESGLVSRESQEFRSPLESRRGSLGAP